MILVSGATGFLGSHLVCYILEQGKKVRALRRTDSDLSEFNYIFHLSFEHLMDIQKAEILKNVDWHVADILDIPELETAFTDVDEVYHCAAIVSFLQKEKQKMMTVNVEGTANMVNLSLQHGVKKFCHVSSIAAIGREKEGIEISEKTKWVNSPLNTNYAISKLKAEKEVWRGIEEGLPAVIINPGVIVGAGKWERGTCKLFDLPWKNFPFYTTGTNGYVDVRDVVKAMYSLMQKPECFSERYILISQNMNMKFFMHETAGYLGKAKAKYRVTPWMAEFAWMFFGLKSILSGKNALITKENARSSLRSYFYTSQKIKTTLGFNFIPIEETLSYICKKFKQDHI